MKNTDNLKELLDSNLEGAKPIYFLKNETMPGSHGYLIGVVDSTRQWRLAFVGKAKMLSDDKPFNLERPHPYKPASPGADVIVNMEIDIIGAISGLDIPGAAIADFNVKRLSSEGGRDHITIGPFPNSFQKIKIVVYFQGPPIGAFDTNNPPYALLY